MVLVQGPTAAITGRVALHQFWPEVEFKEESYTVPVTNLPPTQRHHRHLRKILLPRSTTAWVSIRMCSFGTISVDRSQSAKGRQFRRFSSGNLLPVLFTVISIVSANAENVEQEAVEVTSQASPATRLREDSEPRTQRKNS